MQRLLLLVSCIFGVLADAAAQDVEFNRDVRPILSNHCFACHGPDAAQRQAELRLDREDDAFAKRDKPTIIRGKIAESELIRRITTSDADERMPPAEANKPLTVAQIDTLKRWIAQGAAWQKHWSLISPVRPALPNTLSGPTPENPIDLFIRAELARHDLVPSPAAPRQALLRRASFDLTGLPPTIDDLDAFEADQAPDAYERTVDRLLASPRYGERAAIRWLEAARYADTSGYQNDGERHMWRWRDWVIEAFNRNMPFDQFTIEQLAGDLLPDATWDQRIATGFNRNHRGNAEGGIIPEEYAVEYVVDRVETTSTVWLGLTMGCVRCHDHKFDPFTMQDFYSLYAFFNNVPEKGRAIKFGNSPPYIAAPTYLQRLEFQERVQAEFKEARQRWKVAEGETHVLFLEWLNSFRPRGQEDSGPQHALLARFDLGETDSVARLVNEQAGLTTRDGSAKVCDGPRGSALEFDGTAVLEAPAVGDFGLFDPFSLSAWVYIPTGGGGTIVSRMTDVEQGDGYQLAISDGKLQLNIVKRWLDDSLRVESTGEITAGRWHHVAATFAGFRGDKLEESIQLFLDGESLSKNVLLAELNQPFNTKEPFRIGGGGGPGMRFRGRIDDVQVYSAVLANSDLQLLSTRENVADILAIPREQWTDGQRGKAFRFFMTHHAPDRLQHVYDRREQSARTMADHLIQHPTVMVMEEVSPPRKAFILKRGQYDQPGEEVARDTPAALPPLNESLPKNRLGLAKWLVDPAHPLTSRVAVNRAWQQFFGTGLVKTTEDFGSQGEWPTHPELLDWLAVEFSTGPKSQVQGPKSDARDSTLDFGPWTLGSSAWDLKRLARLIITSASYRQSSAVTPEGLQKDPDNRWLSRAPRQRLSAEMVRDQALAASGLLFEELGGPSVKPYQPPGLWSELTGADDYVQDHGEKLYRRSLYTYWKRTIAPPAMLTFDAATREFCTVRETRTNTPLQALTLLNETGFVEASRKLAERVMHEAGASDDERLTWLFRTVISRRPNPDELAILKQAVARHRQHYQANPDSAKAVLTTGESPADSQLPAGDLAAFTAIAGLVLNLDEAINKE
jgi:mono/diheme cytochrome c family protein